MPVPSERVETSANKIVCMKHGHMRESVCKLKLYLCSRICFLRNACSVSVGETKGKRLICGSTRRWEDAVKMTPKEVGCCNVYWIHLAQDMDQ
jgi:hypothetical protein